jgi:hypothetical protein
MKIELKHPLWTHTPAICLLVIAVFLSMAQMPDRVPVHFGWDGKPNGWGAPWELRFVFVGIPLLVLMISFVIDELYCKFKQRKQFNFLAIFDDGLIGFLLGMEVSVIAAISSSNHVMEGELKLGLEIAVAAMVLATILEFIRKHRPSVVAAPSGEGKLLSNAELANLGEVKHWLHWETQNPLYLRLLMIVIPAFPIPLLMNKSCPLWIPLSVLSVMLFIFFIFYGGMRISVTPERLTLRFGIFGIPVLKMPMDQIISAKANSYNPLVDFGGWGIKYSFSEKMWIYFLSGSRGVRLETATGKSYIIGSDDADRLAAVCQIALRSSGKV